MKIVTYNINGLRARISQHGTLLNLLNSLDADIICFQEIKLSRQELSADLVKAEGYEAFFSCTRASTRGRAIGYSGVVTFCRVKSAFSSNEATLPICAEEGFTGLLGQPGSRYGNLSPCLLEMPLDIEGEEFITEKDLLKVDSEGRCIITDHGHFVLFNLYGPRADPNDPERIRFKTIFFTALQKRWEALLRQGKRVFVVGDINIAPSAIDRCDAGPDFDNDRFRKWLRTLLRKAGGPFVDVFREMHPDRKDAYTCWSQQLGAEEFNFGSRIDLVLISGPCMHQDTDLKEHELFDCHIRQCDIMTEYKRSKDDNIPRWKGGRSVKLDGSDHVPVYVNISGVPLLPPHSTPPLAARYAPEIRGLQQTIVSLLQKKKTDTTEIPATPHDLSETRIPMEPVMDNVTSDELILCCTPTPNCNMNSQSNSLPCQYAEQKNSLVLQSEKRPMQTYTCEAVKEKVKHGVYSQLKLQSFFQKKLPKSNDSKWEISDTLSNQEASLVQDQISRSENCENSSPGILAHGTKLTGSQPNVSTSLSYADRSDLGANHINEQGENSTALKEWKRIQSVMQKSAPLCVGHQEPCVARYVKKAGPNIGRGFYVCARAKGPASNPEARCDHFQWASSKSKRKR